MAAVAKKAAGALYRVEIFVKAIVAVELVAESPEAALTQAHANARKWALEGTSAEICDANVKVVGVSDTDSWGQLS